MTIGSSPRDARQGVFVDLFSGCGGLSLGLVSAGWKGFFAIEKDPWAFSTLKHNLVDAETDAFDWPTWLPVEAMTVEHLLVNYSPKLRTLRGQVDLIAGGPPCQGFSQAGRRNPHDPRNRLTEQYIKVVQLLQPRFLLLENVLGFDTPFSDEIDREKMPADGVAYSEYVQDLLHGLGYRTFTRALSSYLWGVPQTRPRFILIAERDNTPGERTHTNPLDIAEEMRTQFLETKGIPTNRPVTVSQAIGDLRITNRKLIPATDSKIRGFMQIAYRAPSRPNRYLRLMRRDLEAHAMPDSLRLANHKPATVERFREIIDSCKPGRSLTRKDRERLGIRKQATTLLAANKPSATVTTLPDDIIHYSEPRILTVRENARLQSFPDWFEFRGGYTTGGKDRKRQCPRYTQVGNAVPPLLAEGLGTALRTLLDGEAAPVQVSP